MKSYKKILFIFLIICTILFGFFPKSNVLGIPNDINYTFTPNHLFETDSIVVNESINRNVVNTSSYTQTYNATYSFTNENVGVNGTDIDFVDIVSTSENTIIENNYEGHSKVLKQSGNTDNFYSIFSNQFSGIIEMWYLTLDSTLRTDILVYENSDLNIQLAVGRVGTNKLWYFSGGWFDIGNIISNFWYHIKIEWYSNNTFDIYLNNLIVASNINFLLSMTNGNDRFRFRTYSTVINYLDAIGYSWQNSIIDFESDIIGQEPIGWISTGLGSTSALVIDNSNTQLLEMNDTDTFELVELRTIITQTINQTISFDVSINTTLSNQGFQVRFNEDFTSTTVRLRISNDDFEYFDGSSWFSVKDNFILPNIFFHVSFTLNDDTNTFDIWINDVLEGSNLDYDDTSTISLNQILLLTDAFGHSKAFFDNLTWSSGAYNINDNLIPYLITDIDIKEVDKFEFTFANNITSLNAIGLDNPSGWTDIENGFDHTNIAQDNTDISEGSRTLSRVVDIEGNGASHEITGLTRAFDIPNGIFNFTLKYNYSLRENVGGFNFSITNYDDTPKLDLTVIFPSPVFGGQLAYFNGSEYITLLNFIGSIIGSNTEVEYNIYIDSFVILQYIAFSKSLGYQNATYYFPVLNPTSKGIADVSVFSEAQNDPGSNNLLHIKEIGVYSNSSSLSDDFGFVPFRLNINSWLFIAHNLFIFNGSGIVGMYATNYIEYFIENSPSGNNLLEPISTIKNFDGSQTFINLYFNELVVPWSQDTIFFPAILFFTNDEFNVSTTSFSIDGIKFIDDIGHDYGFLDYESGGVENNESFFFIDNDNRLQFTHLTDDIDIIEYISIIINIQAIDVISTNNTAIRFTSNKNAIASGFFRVVYELTSSVFEIQSIPKTTTVFLPNNLEIIEYIVIITDNNDNTVSGLTTGFITDITLLTSAGLNPIVSISIVALIAMMIPIILIITPSLLISSLYGKDLLVPLFLIMSLVSVITSLIPTWLFFVIAFSLSIFLIQKKDVLFE